VQRLQAFKYELLPNSQQERQMRRFASSCRFVYNKALALQKERHEQGQKKLGYAGLCQLLTAWRHSTDTAWLADAPVHPLQQALQDLERAHSHFFAQRAGFPKFKKKGRSDSFRYSGSETTKLDQVNSRIYLPKLGWMRYRNSREVLGTVKSVTVSKHAGKWFASIQTEREVNWPIPQGGAVGMDMGIARLATLSDGTFYAPLNSFKRHEARLRKAQQALSRKVKFSNNWKKAKARLQRIHSQMANARRDFLHKVSTAISKSQAIVCIEDLRVRNMSKSAAGTADAPGKNVRAKSALNKAILDQGWYEFRCMLEYKLAWKGGRLIVVPPQNPSRTCPCCGHVSSDNRQTQAWFECVACGYENNADRGSGPEAFRGSGPEAFRGSGPEAFRGSGPEAFRGSGPEAFRGSGPEAFRGSGPEAFRGSGPEAFRGSGPEAFRGSGPEAFRGSGPEAFLVGAINILARGIQLLRDEGQDTTDAAVGMRVGEPPVSARMACGSNCTGGRKQEPAETTAQGAIHAQRGRNLQPSGRGGCQFPSFTLLSGSAWSQWPHRQTLQRRHPGCGHLCSAGLGSLTQP
jgi:putative transposase